MTPYQIKQMKDLRTWFIATLACAGLCFVAKGLAEKQPKKINAIIHQTK